MSMVLPWVAGCYLTLYGCSKLSFKSVKELKIWAIFVLLKTRHRSCDTVVDITL